MRLMMVTTSPHTPLRSGGDSTRRWRSQVLHAQHVSELRDRIDTEGDRQRQRDAAKHEADQDSGKPARDRAGRRIANPTAKKR